MNVDELDINIFQFLLDEKEHTSTQIAKNIFKPETDIELRNADTKIRYRLKKWCEAEFIKVVNKNKKNYYYIKIDDIYGGKGTLLVKSFKNGNLIEIPFGNVFIIVENGYHHIIGIDVDN